MASEILQGHERVETCFDQWVHTNRDASEQILNKLRVGCTSRIDILLKAGFVLKVVSKCLGSMQGSVETLPPHG
jgi:hypothetical protein